MTETKAQQKCPYCHDPYKLLLDEPGIKELISKSDRDCYLTTIISNFGFSNFKLNYCLVCGRKLEVSK